MLPLLEMVTMTIMAMLIAVSTCFYQEIVAAVPVLCRN